MTGGAPPGETFVQFDIRWDASWRASWADGANTWTNWDAAWIFVKYRPEGQEYWEHASLNTTPANHVIPAGATLDIGMTGGTGVGGFLYRSAEGSGSWSNNGVKLRWLYAADGVVHTSKVDVSVHAIEAALIPAICDGYDRSAFIQTLLDYGLILGRYRGNAYDGYDHATLSQVPLDYSLILGRYRGNAHDGYDHATFLQVPPDYDLILTRYKGFGFDGYDKAEFLQTNTHIDRILTRFRGGIHDGYAFTRLTGFSFKLVDPNGALIIIR